MRDDQDFNIEFCQLMEKYPALYDYTIPEYNNRNIQDKCWIEIARKLKEPAKDCKDRWVNLRGRYSKYKKAEALANTDGGKPIKPYYLSPHLQYLDKFLKRRKPRKNNYIDYTPQSESEGEAEAEDENENEYTNAFPVAHFMSKEGPDPLEYEGFPNSSQTPLNDTNKRSSDYDYGNELKKQARTGSVELPDPDLAFFHSVLPDMKLMNADQKRLFKIRILNLATEILRKPNIKEDFNI